MAIHALKKHPLALLDFELVHIAKGKKTSWRSDDFETVAVLIEGSCSLSLGGKRWQAKRRSVFVDQASAVYFSPGETLSITATEPTTIALCKAKASKTFGSVFVSPDEVKSEWRGREGSRRRVFNIVNTETKTQRIAVGETINEPGQWSSFPSHKHDVREERDGVVIEVPLEEIYYFRVEPETGFGFQRLYAADGSFDEAYVIRDGDTTHIPSGYHPVANIPGHKLYYLWMLAGEERRYIWNTDPALHSLQ